MAREPFFQFENELISLRDIFYRLNLDAFCDLRLRCMTLDVYQNVWGRALRSMAHEVLPQQGLPTGNIGSDFSTLHQLLAHRCPSVAADEALCISTKLQLPLEELVQVPNTVPDRMSKMWELVAKTYGVIPQHILFLKCPKLDVKDISEPLAHYWTRTHLCAEEEQTLGRILSLVELAGVDFRFNVQGS